jgi:hypothetical protein
MCGEVQDEACIKLFLLGENWTRSWFTRKQQTLTVHIYLKSELCTRKDPKSLELKFKQEIFTRLLYFWYLSYQGRKFLPLFLTMRLERRLSPLLLFPLYFGKLETGIHLTMTKPEGLILWKSQCRQEGVEMGKLRHCRQHQHPSF